MDIASFEKLQPKKLKSGRTRSEAAKYASKRGKAGEHKIVNILTEASGETWRRIPASGAFVGGLNRSRLFDLHESMIGGVLGDIFAPGIYANHFIIESKNYGTFPFKKLESGELPAKLKGWIEEIMYDTESYLLFKEKHTVLRPVISFLVFTIKNKGTWICYNEGHFIKKNINKMNPVYNITINPMQKLLEENFTTKWFIEDFKSFINNNKDMLFK